MCCSSQSCAAPSAAAGVPRQLSRSKRSFRSCCAPILWFGHTMFLAGLLFGRDIGWIGQARDDHAVPCVAGAAQICGRTRCSAGLRSASSAPTQPAAFAYVLLLAGGPALSIPFAVRDGAGRRSAASLPGSASAGCRRRPRRPRICSRWRLPAIHPAAPPPLTARSSRCFDALRTARGIAAVAAHLLRRPRRAPRRWTGSMAASSTAAIWCSTSAPMSATASPRSAGSAPGSSRSSRSPRWCKALQAALRPRRRRRDRGGRGRPRSRASSA